MIDTEERKKHQAGKEYIDDESEKEWEREIKPWGEGKKGKRETEEKGGKYGSLFSADRRRKEYDNEGPGKIGWTRGRGGE